MKPRQSTVCDMCRSRKLGCDGRKPSCSQCLHSGRQCPGYQKTLVFLPPTTTRSAVTKAGVRKDIRAGRGKSKTLGPVGHRTETRSPVNITRTLTWPLNDVLSLCVQNFVPHSELNSTSRDICASQSRICGGWIIELPELVGRGADELLPSAIRALGTALVARGRNGRAPIHEALQTQCLALKALQRAIHLTGGAAHDELAASIMCLYLSERMLPMTTAGPTVHARGISELIQLRQPSFYASGVSHRLFVGFRPLLILHSLTSCTPSFLAESDWQREPFSHVGTSPLQDLMNEASIIPTILEKLDNFKSTPLVTEAVARSAARRLSRVLGRLERLYESTQVCSEDALWRPHHWTDIDDTSIFFPNITVANCTTYFWAFWVVCVTRIRQVVEWFPDLVDQGILVNGQNPTSEPVTKTLLELSKRILHSINYLIQDEMKIYGIASADYPFQIACATLGSSTCIDSGLQLLSRQVQENIFQKGYEDFLQLVPRN